MVKMSNEKNTKMISVDGVDVKIESVDNYSLVYEYTLIYTEITDNSKSFHDCITPLIKEYKIAAEADVGFVSMVTRGTRYTIDYLKDGTQKRFRTSDKASAWDVAYEHRTNGNLVGMSVNVSGSIRTYP